MTLAQRFVAGQFILFAIFGIAWLILPRSVSILTLGIGLVFLLAAVAILLLAMREFQRQSNVMPNITPTPNQQTGLVQSGIYRSVRHPIYTAVIAGALGAAFLHGHVILFALVVVFVIFFTFKSSYEETLLTSVFPEYPAYMRRSGRFLPYF